MSNEAATHVELESAMADKLENSPVAAAKDVISSIFGSAACVYTGQVRWWTHLSAVFALSTKLTTGTAVLLQPTYIYL